MYFLIGLIHTFVGSFNQYLKIEFNMNQSDVSNLISIQFTTFMIGVFYSILSFSKSIKNTLKVIHLLILIIVTAFVFFENFLLLYFLIAILGFCAGLIESSIASYIFNNKFNSAKVFGYIESFFAIGALLLPIIVWLFESYSNTKFSVLFILIVNIFSLWIVSSLTFEIDNKKKSNLTNVFTNKKFMIIIIILIWCFFYISIETNFSNLLPYMNLVSDNLSYITVSIFWFGIIIGRLLYAIILSKIKIRLESLLLLYTIISLLLYIILIYSDTADLFKLILLFLLTLFFAPMFPLGASIINRFSSNKNLLTSIFIAVAGIGGAIGATIIRTALTLNIPAHVTILSILLICLFLSIIITKITRINV
ncbi:MFS transporter [Staphylococcus schleiferi]|nr:MFS transporter [Staphylococcus schleiferi]UXR56152.1 MFS transporter [Staphylococcus schleiferi]UXR58436.1 MFS transporter [Staphylococcus schleiferi]UXR60720.1 MFS transporter [Staphylococcus schleiferi]UXR63061.1 MFS transporter [Staphylococcus schleiferi]